MRSSGAAVPVRCLSAPCLSRPPLFAGLARAARRVAPWRACWRPSKKRPKKGFGGPPESPLPPSCPRSGALPRRRRRRAVLVVRAFVSGALLFGAAGARARRGRAVGAGANKVRGAAFGQPRPAFLYIRNARARFPPRRWSVLVSAGCVFARRLARWLVRGRELGACPRAPFPPARPREVSAGRAKVENKRAAQARRALNKGRSHFAASSTSGAKRISTGSFFLSSPSARRSKTAILPRCSRASRALLTPSTAAASLITFESLSRSALLNTSASSSSSVLCSSFRVTRVTAALFVSAMSSPPFLGCAHRCPSPWLPGFAGCRRRARLLQGLPALYLRRHLQR